MRDKHFELPFVLDLLGFLGCIFCFFVVFFLCSFRCTFYESTWIFRSFFSFTLLFSLCFLNSTNYFFRALFLCFFGTFAFCKAFFSLPCRCLWPLSSLLCCRLQSPCHHEKLQSVSQNLCQMFNLHLTQAETHLIRRRYQSSEDRACRWRCR